MPRRHMTRLKHDVNEVSFLRHSRDDDEDAETSPEYRYMTVLHELTYDTICRFTSSQAWFGFPRDLLFSCSKKSADAFLVTASLRARLRKSYVSLSKIQGKNMTHFDVQFQTPKNLY